MTKEQKKSYHKNWRERNKDKWNAYMRKYYANRTLNKISAERSALERKLAREIIDEMDNALHDMAMEYHNAGHPEYFAVCEMVHHKVIRPIEKKYTEDTNNGA
jgi:hypothetical protein